MILENFQGVTYRDLEGEAVLSLIGTLSNKIVELGCGSRKTVPIAIGLDCVEKGKPIFNVFPPGNSVADIVCDVSKTLPIDKESFDCAIARHTIEHIVDLSEALFSWNQILKENGQLIIAIPNHEWANTIEMDKTHVHAFTPKSLIGIVEKFGFKHIETVDPLNKISIVLLFKKES